MDIRDLDVVRIVTRPRSGEGFVADDQGSDRINAEHLPSETLSGPAETGDLIAAQKFVAVRAETVAVRFDISRAAIVVEPNESTLSDRLTNQWTHPTCSNFLLRAHL